MDHRILRTIGASIVLAGLVLAAAVQIGSNGEPAAEVATADTTPSTQLAISQASTTTAQEPFVYRIGVLSGPSTDNYWAYYGAEPSVWNSYVLGPTKPALYTLGRGSGTIAPELATGRVEPTWDEDGWRVRVSLASDFEWSDGTPITAKDFVFTFETVRSLGLGGSWETAFPAAVESVHADSEHQLRIEFTERPNLSVWPYGVGLAPVMPRHVWEDRVDGIDAEGLYSLSGRSDVGGGPLALVAASEGLVVSNANPGYPGDSGPDVVEYHVYQDETSLVDAVAKGDVDTVMTPKGIPPDLLEGLESNPDVSVISSPANGVRYLGFNLHRQPMSDLAFRTALALLVDRDDLAEAIPQSGDAAWTVLPRANRQWYDDEQASEERARYEGTPAERLARALEGLRAAGYAWAQEPALDGAGMLVAGTGLTIDGVQPQPLTILTPGDAYDPARPDYVAEIARVLGILGFDARPVETDFDTVVDLAFTPGEDGALHYDMYLLGWTLGNPALPSFYRPLFAGDGAMNNTGYASDVFNAALSDFEEAFTAEEAGEALWVMEAALSVDLPYLPLYTSQITEVYRSDRIVLGESPGLGGLQASLGAMTDVRQKS